MKNKNKFHFRRGHVGSLHKIQGYQNISKCRPHHSGDICFSFMDQNVKQRCIFWAIGGGGGPDWVFNYQTGPILLSSYPPTHIYVHV